MTGSKLRHRSAWLTGVRIEIRLTEDEVRAQTAIATSRLVSTLVVLLKPFLKRDYSKTFARAVALNASDRAAHRTVRYRPLKRRRDFPRPSTGVGLPCARSWLGVFPVQRLKARVNALISRYPSNQATWETGRSPCLR
jgi:hypothetical protein